MTIRNWCKNPSLELDHSGWSSSAAPTVRAAGTWGSGNYIARSTLGSTGVVGRARYGQLGQDIQVAPGDVVRAAIRVRAGTGTEGKRLTIRAVFRDALATEINVSIGNTVYLSSDPQVLALFYGVADPNVNHVMIEMFTEASETVAGETFESDMLDVRVNQPLDVGYIDGDQGACIWEGTPHASTSIRVDPEEWPESQRWRSGAVDIAGKLYLANDANERIGDLSDHIVKGNVGWNADRGAGVKLSGDFILDQRGLVDPAIDYVAPVLEIEWAHGIRETKQFGLFLADWPEDTLYQKYGWSRFKGFDPTFLLNNSVLRDVLNWAAADNVSDKMEELALTVWDRVNFTASSRTFGVAKSAWPAQRKYKIMTDHMNAIGFYEPYSDLDGVIRSTPFLDLANADPAIVITMEDPVGEVRVLPTTTELANVIIVFKEGTGEELPLWSIAENADPGSRVSTVYRPELVREIANAQIKTQAEADALVLQYLRESGSFYQVVSTGLSPGTWPGPHQAVDILLQHTNWGSIAGRYRLREWNMGFTQSDANLAIEANRDVEFIDEDQI